MEPEVFEKSESIDRVSISFGDQVPVELPQTKYSFIPIFVSISFGDQVPVERRLLKPFATEQSNGYLRGNLFQDEIIDEISYTKF
ncbi:MAG TPA: hypothetical protein DC064_11390 [Cyanobacteria bacterium UBA9273]|nr:hypothetical protein [Cyanobacteria bacterium UBA9273]